MTVAVSPAFSHGLASLTGGGMAASQPPHQPPPGAAHHGHGHAPPSSHVAAYVADPVTGPPYSAGPYGMPAAWGRGQIVTARRNARAQQACETCRQRKARCDEGRPVCGYCRENSHECRYKDVQPAKADRAQKELMDQIDKLQKRQDDSDDKIGKILDILLDQRPALRPSSHQTSPTPIASHVMTTTGPPNASPTARTEPLDLDAQHGKYESRPISPARTPRPPHDVGSISIDSDDAADADLSVGSIKTFHFTGAHNLFRWKAVQDLLQGRVPGENFVMQHEEQKGLLRIFGKGQGIDRGDGGWTITSTLTPAEEVLTVQSPIAASTVTPSETWGTGTGRPVLSEQSRLAGGGWDHPGGLNPDGSLKLDKSTMYELEKSYLDNMHLLHPFLDRPRLRRAINRVSELAQPLGEGSQNRSPITSFSGSTAMEGRFRGSASSLKRKRSFDEASLDPSRPRGGEAQILEKRISTAIVLLVMALGKILAHHGDLPGPLAEPPSSSHSSSAMQFKDLVTSSNLTGSPFSHVNSPATTASPPELRSNSGGVASQRSVSADGSSYPVVRRPERNVDIIPGLAYFGRAVEILGSLQGNDLPHVQAYLLAALYAGQLACVIESWTWIQSACRACHFLVRDPSLKRVRATDPPRAEAIQFAYWTCHQLEGDILAEMDLHSSGIAEVTTVDQPPILPVVPVPPEELEQETHTRVFYLSQIYLRSRLNQYQELLYPENLYRHDASFSIDVRNTCDETLSEWRVKLPPYLIWHDNDPLPTDINNARLRAKFYGAKYIIHRPLLYYALQYLDDHLRHPAVLRQYEAIAHDHTGIRLGTADGDTSDRHVRILFQVLISCRLCIEAAKRSTIAFDGIWPRKRLMVTNIFGTAHAQFGNAIVLSATLESKLGWLLDRGEVIALVKRTIRFLRGHSAISSTLAHDADILETVLHRLERRASSFGVSSGQSTFPVPLPPLNASYNSSFSSQ